METPAPSLQTKTYDVWLTTGDLRLTTIIQPQPFRWGKYPAIALHIWAHHIAPMFITFHLHAHVVLFLHLPLFPLRWVFLPLLVLAYVFLFTLRLLMVLKVDLIRPLRLKKIDRCIFYHVYPIRRSRILLIGVLYLRLRQLHAQQQTYGTDYFHTTWLSSAG